MGFLGVTEASYYTKMMNVKLTDKQKMMVGIMCDILGESRSAIVRRLLMVEAKKCAANLDGEELELWTDLINQIEKEEDLHEFVVGEAISNGRREAYKERTGHDLDDMTNREMSKTQLAQREWHQRKRVKEKMEKLKQLEQEYAA